MDNKEKEFRTVAQSALQELAAKTKKQTHWGEDHTDCYGKVIAALNSYSGYEAISWKLEDNTIIASGDRELDDAVTFGMQKYLSGELESDDLINDLLTLAERSELSTLSA